MIPTRSGHLLRRPGAGRAHRRDRGLYVAQVAGCGQPRRRRMASVLGSAGVLASFAGLEVRASFSAASAKIGMDIVTALGTASVICICQPCCRQQRPSPSGRLIRKEEMLPTPEEAVLRNFMRDGRIVAMPAKRSRRLVLLNHITQMFEVGLRYSESEVNRKLRNLHDDYAALRRYLVDEGFMTREHGEYWRTGGSVDI